MGLGMMGRRVANELLTAPRLYRREGASTGLLVAACSSAAPAQPTAAPAKPTTAPAAAPPTTAPAAPKTGAAAPAAKSDFQAEWDALVEAAKKEVGSSFRRQRARATVSPWMSSARRSLVSRPEHSPFPDSATYLPKIANERQAGIYSIDVIASTVTPLLQVLKPQGIIDPVKPC